MTQGSFGFHEKSLIFAVWPPWINYRKCKRISNILGISRFYIVKKKKEKERNILYTSNSGGPSSASSLDCSSPILLRSHTWRRLSVPLLANIVSLCGDHWTWKISSLWDSKECNFNLRFLKSQSATVLSALPVARINSEYGLKLKQFTSAVWASTVWLGLLVLLHLIIVKIRRAIKKVNCNNIYVLLICQWLCVMTYNYLVSQIINFWSSATDPNKDSCNRCQATSSTTAVCPVKIVFASITRFSLGGALISHKQIVWSSDALSKYPFKFGFHDRPYPSFWCPLNLTSKILKPSLYEFCYL